MKPRLSPAPLTKEDTVILYRCAAGQLCPPGSWRRADAYRAADRRDADLMLFIGESTGQMRVDHPGDPDGDFSWTAGYAAGAGYGLDLVKQAVDALKRRAPAQPAGEDS